MKKLLSILIIMVLLAGCDLTSGKRWTEHRVVIAGSLPAGGYLDTGNPIRIGKTISADGGNVSDLFDFDAVVYLKNMTRADSVQLAFYADNSVFGFIDSNNEMKIRFGETYRIDAIVDGNHVWAETTVPDSVFITTDPLGNATGTRGYSTSNTEPLPQIEFDTCNEQFPVEVLFTNNKNFNMRYRYYCLEDFSTDLEYTTVVLGIEHPTSDQEDDWNPDFGGGMRENNWIARYQPILNQNNRWSFNDDYYASGFSFYGKYLFEIKIMDDNYYKYLSYPEGYRFGGVNGGLGYLGSDYAVTFYTNIVKQYSR
ncbi:MAG: DUF4249 family protein [Candidatus Cloacimonetes bacterium]|nr:DUF4249 family protein [Candidatus Cloacimonadota bacterium]